MLFTERLGNLSDVQLSLAEAGGRPASDGVGVTADESLVNGYRPPVCPHLAVRTRGPAAGSRSSQPAVVCACSCPSACPLAGRIQVSRADWQRECTCACAAAAGGWPDDGAGQVPGFAEFVRTSGCQRRDRAAARAEAFAAASSAAEGNIRDQIR